MPDTVKSLKIENDELKNQVIGLKADLKHFEESILKKLQDMKLKWLQLRHQLIVRWLKALTISVMRMMI
jgi:hypothetical protein